MSLHAAKSGNDIFFPIGENKAVYQKIADGQPLKVGTTRTLGKGRKTVDIIVRDDPRLTKKLKAVHVIEVEVRKDIGFVLLQAWRGEELVYPQSESSVPELKLTGKQEKDDELIADWLIQTGPPPKLSPQAAEPDADDDTVLSGGDSDADTKSPDDQPPPSTSSLARSAIKRHTDRK